MNFIIILFLLISLSVTGGILFAVWKFSHAILERYKVEDPKLAATLICIISFILLIYLMNSTLTGTRWFGC